MDAIRQRLAGAGIRRPPWLTLTVFLCTAVPSCLQAAVPATLHDLERTPAGLTGQWWRSVTSLTVQDGGVLGTLSNLAFLLIIGTIAEQVLTRPRWLALYLVPGLAGEFVAYSWQLTGGGNSVAVCGLSGALAVLMLRDPRCAPPVAAYAQLLWVGCLVATASAIAGGLIFGAAGLLLRLSGGRSVPVAAVSAAAVSGAAVSVAAVSGVAVLACGAALAADQDIHGAALVAGALLSIAIVSPAAHSPFVSYSSGPR
jgi:membrane associated rhomboid family serine protease